MYLASGGQNNAGLMGLSLPQDAPPLMQAPQGQPPQQPAAPQGQPPQQPAAPQGQPPQQPAAPQGQGKYNGEITYEGKSMQVINGVTKDKQGDTFIISNDGSIVTDAKTHQIAGHVEDGKFIPITQEYLDKLKKAGVIANTDEKE